MTKSILAAVSDVQKSVIVLVILEECSSEAIESGYEKQLDKGIEDWQPEVFARQN